MEIQISCLYFYKLKKKKNYLKKNLASQFKKNSPIFLEKGLKFGNAFALGYLPNFEFSGVISMVQWIKEQFETH